MENKMFCYQCQETNQNKGCTKVGSLWEDCNRCEFTRYVNLDYKGTCTSDG